MQGLVASAVRPVEQLLIPKGAEWLTHDEMGRASALPAHSAQINRSVAAAVTIEPAYQQAYQPALQPPPTPRSRLLRRVTYGAVGCAVGLVAAELQSADRGWSCFIVGAIGVGFAVAREEEEDRSEF